MRRFRLRRTHVLTLVMLAEAVALLRGATMPAQVAKPMTAKANDRGEAAPLSPMGRPAVLQEGT